VLTTIWVPIIFIQKGELNISLLNPYLIAASAAILIAATTKSIYLTLVVSLVIFVSMRFIG
jgi:branched-subunit amino acid transport protein